MNDRLATENERLLDRCPACGCEDLFVRKAFPQKLGLAIVVLAAAGFLILAARRQTFWIGALVLVAAAALDAVLYALVPKITVCYRCRNEYAGRVNPAHRGFDLAIAEKYRRT